MSKYGMSQEEYKVFVNSDEPPEGWLTYSWEVGFVGLEEMWFPNEKVAKAYFAANGIISYYLETV
jgi:hypothetical protein